MSAKVKGEMKIKNHGIPIFFLVFLLTLFSLEPMLGQRDLHRSDMTEEVGIKVGQAIPPIRARDQHGNWRDFDSLKGPSRPGHQFQSLHRLVTLLQGSAGAAERVSRTVQRAGA